MGVYVKWKWLWLITVRAPRRSISLLVNCITFFLNFICVAAKMPSQMKWSRFVCLFIVIEEAIFELGVQQGKCTGRLCIQCNPINGISFNMWIWCWLNRRTIYFPAIHLHAPLQIHETISQSLSDSPFDWFKYNEIIQRKKQRSFSVIIFFVVSRMETNPSLSGEICAREVPPPVRSCNFS